LPSPCEDEKEKEKKMEEMKEEEMEEKEMKEGEESNCNSRVLEFYRHVQIREKKK
jgi:hypothetical protein